MKYSLPLAQQGSLKMWLWSKVCETARWFKRKKKIHKMHYLSEVQTPCISSVNFFFDSIQ